MEPLGVSPGLPAWPPPCPAVYLAPWHSPAQGHTWCLSPKAGKGKWKLGGSSPVSSSLSVPALSACSSTGCSVEQSWVWHCQLSLVQPHSCSLCPAKAGNSPGCPGAVSLSHGSPGYSVSCFCHTRDLPKAPEQLWGTAMAKEGFTSCEQTPGTPRPSRAGKGALPGLGSCTRANTSVGALLLQALSAPAWSSHVQQETSISPGSSSKDNTSGA